MSPPPSLEPARGAVWAFYLTGRGCAYVRYLAVYIPPHFFGPCPKKREWSPKEKRLFLGGSTLRTVCVPPASPSGPLRLHDVWAREGLLRLNIQGWPSRLTIENKVAAALWAAFYFIID